MRIRFGLVIAATLAAMAPSATVAQSQSIDERTAPVVEKAFSSIQNGSPADAVATLSPVLAEYDKLYAGDKRRIYCGMTPVQALGYMALAASIDKKRDAVAINPGWCTAQYVNAFALVDLKRLDDAQAAFERLVGFAPQHSRYLNELAYVLQQKRLWQASIDMYGRARDAADLTPDRRDVERCAALRGIGYDLVELGKLDDAEAAYRQCLAITPGEPKSLGEIEYIRQQRKKAI